MRLPFSSLFLLFLAVCIAGCSKNHADSPPPAAAPEQKNPGPHRTDGAAKVHFFNNADSSPLLELIDGAAASLDIEIYEMNDLDVLAALRRAVDRGVKIRVVHEPAALGSRCDLFGAEAGDKSEGCKAERDLKEAIVASGGSFVPFQKDVFCADPAKPCFLHGKMVIADGQAALVSTGNFNSSNLCNRSRDPKVCNRDFSVVSRDAEVVQFLSAVAENDLAQKSYDLSSMFTPSLKDKVTVSPFSLDPLVALVDSAVRSIRIENQYLTEPTLNAAIMAAARRGVHVEVTVASLCSFGPPNPKQKEASATLFTDFERAGIDVRLLPSQFQIGGRPGYLHAKAMVIDGASAWVGSVNGSWSALSNNREFGLFFSNAEAVAPLEKILADDHASTDMETWQESLACAKDPHVLQP